MTIDSARPTAAVSLSVRFPDFPNAACRGADPEKFFPGSGGANQWTTLQAKAICATCDERLRCLEWALDRNEWGIWGGTTDNQRNKIRRRRRR